MANQPPTGSRRVENHDNRFFACHLDCKVKERKYVVSLGEFSVLFLEFFFSVFFFARSPPLPVLSSGQCS